MIVMRSAHSARCAIWWTLVCCAGFARAQASEWEGAIGPLLSNAPAYAGAADRRTKLLPGFYLRHGRFSVTNASGFIARNNEEVVRGLGMDLSPHGALKVSLGLRFDGGRSESTSGALSGLGSIRPTLRARLAMRWLADEHWRVGGAFSVDALGRGGVARDAVTQGLDRAVVNLVVQLVHEFHAYAAAVGTIASERGRPLQAMALEQHTAAVVQGGPHAQARHTGQGLD